MTIGREAPADIVLLDTFLSRSHFQLHIENGLFGVTDTGSSNGMFVNGVRLNRSELRHGDTIYAGRTVLRLSVLLEGKPALDTLPETPKSFLPWQVDLLTLLEQKCNFVVLDGAISPAVRDLLNLAGVFYQSLYEGEKAAELAPRGPFLVELTRGSILPPFLVKAAWGRSWGIFAVAELSFDEMRKHLRRFLIVDTEAGKRLLFRFYDPRILRTFLPTCDLHQRKEFFGPIQLFVAESEDADSVILLNPVGQEVRRLQ
jgi:hypothetical protein